jgi:hypothetical protein
MAVAFFSRLNRGIARQLQPLAHFSEQGPGPAHSMHPRPSLGQRFLVTALDLGRQLHTALNGIGGRA